MAAQVYCDLDGVHVDFAKGVREFFGLVLPRDSSAFNRVWESDQGWKRLQREWPTFWMDLDPLPHSAYLWSVLRPYHPAILTASPPGWASAATGKRTWVQQHLSTFGSHPRETFHSVKRSDKAHFARGPHGESNILIDDFAKNIAEWRAAGGIGILYSDSKQGVNAVKYALHKYIPWWSPAGGS